MQRTEGSGTSPRSRPDHRAQVCRWSSVRRSHSTRRSWISSGPFSSSGRATGQEG